MFHNNLHVHYLVLRVWPLVTHITYIAFRTRNLLMSPAYIACLVYVKRVFHKSKREFSSQSIIL